MSDRHQTGPVVIEIEDILPPATFSCLVDGLPVLWDVLKVLPLGWTQYEAYREFFGDGAEERVKGFLERDGQLALSFAMGGRSHLVKVAPADGRRG